MKDKSHRGVMVHKQFIKLHRSQWRCYFSRAVFWTALWRWFLTAFNELQTNDIYM